MKDRYKVLLEQAYELEGLLLLALKKEEVSDQLSALIERKINEFGLREEPIEEPAQEKAVDSMSYYNIEDDDEEHRPQPERRRPRPEPRRGKPVFSLNDRFLFIREIFAGDAKTFNVVLNHIAGCSGFAEAEDYLMGEHGLNAEANETHARFIEVISDYFKS